MDPFTRALIGHIFMRSAGKGFSGSFRVTVLQLAQPFCAGFFEQDGGGANAKGNVTYSGYAVKHGGAVSFLAVTCSHLGCSVNFNADHKRFECPCHGSRFSIDGQVIHGPALFPLSHLKVAQQGEQLLFDGFTVTA